MILALERWDEMLPQIPEAWWYLDEEMTIKVDLDLVDIRSTLACADHVDFWRWQ